MSHADLRASVMEQLTAPTGPYPVRTTRIRGVELRVYESTPDSIRDVLVTGRLWGERLALTYEGEHGTWATYLDLVGRLGVMQRPVTGSV